MAIAIVVETGSGDNPAANSYVSKSDALTYAAERGFNLSDLGDDVVEAMLIKGMDYLVQYTDRWKGDQVQPGVQPLDWPRTGAMIETYKIADDEIPVLLKRALCQLVIEQHNGSALSVTVEPGLPIVREQVDVIETQYASPMVMRNFDHDFTQPRFPQVEFLLAKLFVDDGFQLRTLRI